MISTISTISTVLTRWAGPSPRRAQATPGCLSAAGAAGRVTRRWLAGLTTVLLLPIAGWLAHGGSAGLWAALTTVTGLLALSVMVCTVVLACRLRALSRAVGMTTIMYAHRLLGILSAALVLVHVACSLAADPRNIRLLSWVDAPSRVRAAIVATVALAGLTALGVLRHRIGNRYEGWRGGHLALAALALLMAALHVMLIDKIVADPAASWPLGVLAAVVVAAVAYRGHGALSRSSAHVVCSVRHESETVCTVALEPLGTPLCHAPGQFAWLRLQRGGVLDEHPFTIASAAGGPHTEVTVRSTGDFGALLRGLTPGTTVWIDGPYGGFTVDDHRSGGTVMIAAGVGITPMMSMLRTLAARHDLRPVLLVRGAGDVDELVFADELAHLAGQLNLAVVTALRRPPPAWPGPRGDVGVELLTAVLPPPPQRNDLEYFVCGPARFVAPVLSALDTLGISARRVHTEQFDPV